MPMGVRELGRTGLSEMMIAGATKLPSFPARRLGMSFTSMRLEKSMCGESENGGVFELSWSISVSLIDYFDAKWLLQPLPGTNFPWQ